MAAEEKSEVAMQERKEVMEVEQKPMGEEMEMLEASGEVRRHRRRQGFGTWV